MPRGGLWRQRTSPTTSRSDGSLGRQSDRRAAAASATTATPTSSGLSATACARTGRPLVFMPAEAYAVMSDRDLAALIGYLRACRRWTARFRHPGSAHWPGRSTWSATSRCLPAELVDHSARSADRRGRRHGRVRSLSRHRGRMPELSRHEPEGRRQSGCAGDRSRDDSTPGPRPTSSARSARGAPTRRERCIDPEKMPWVRSGQMTDDEIRAVWRYLRS